jgi:hypothetical protein
VDDYFRWVQKKLLKDRPREVPDREEPTAPSEPMKVEEHHASTTIIERLYSVLGKRSWLMNIFPLLLQIIALVCLLLATLNMTAPSGKFAWFPAGMFFWLLSLMVSGIVLHQINHWCPSGPAEAWVSWSGTFSHTVLYAVDVLFGTLFWSVPDITISALCDVVALADAQVAGPAPGDLHDWPARLGSLKLWGWQIGLLRFIGPWLNRIQTDHMELARQADIERARRILDLLRWCAVRWCGFLFEVLAGLVIRAERISHRVETPV